MPVRLASPLLLCMRLAGFTPGSLHCVPYEMRLSLSPLLKRYNRDRALIAYQSTPSVGSLPYVLYGYLNAQAQGLGQFFNLYCSATSRRFKAYQIGLIRSNSSHVEERPSKRRSSSLVLTSHQTWRGPGKAAESDRRTIAVRVPGIESRRRDRARGARMGLGRGPAIAAAPINDTLDSRRTHVKRVLYLSKR